ALSQYRFGEWYLKPWAVAASLLALAALVMVTLKGWTDYVVVSPIAAVIVVALTAVRGQPLPFGKTLGGISFPFHLHPFVGLLFSNPMVRRLGMTEWQACLAALGIGLGLNWAHYRVIDRNVHAKRDRWYSPTIGIACFSSGILLLVLGFAAAWVAHRWPP